MVRSASLWTEIVAFCGDFFPARGSRELARIEEFFALPACRAREVLLECGGVLAPLLAARLVQTQSDTRTGHTPKASAKLSKNCCFPVRVNSRVSLANLRLRRSRAGSSAVVCSVSQFVFISVHSWSKKNVSARAPKPTLEGECAPLCGPEWQNFLLPGS